MSHLSGLLRLVGAAGLTIALNQPCSAAAHSLDLYLPDAPPLTLVDDHGRHGIVGDVTLKAARLAGYDLRLINLPWARAQQTVRAGTDQLIIPLSRTPDREAHYTWIAPVMTMDRAFFSLGKRVENFEQARRTYARIAVGRGSAQEQKLREEGFSDTQIYPVKIGENPAQLLLLGRVDAWFNGIPETRTIWPQVSSRPLLMSPEMMHTELYLACSKVCDAQLVERLSEAVRRLREDGTVAKVLGEYVPDQIGVGVGAP
jgi:polar amino acid transport system substrate-binding protein